MKCFFILALVGICTTEIEAEQRRSQPPWFYNTVTSGRLQQVSAPHGYRVLEDPRTDARVITVVNEAEPILCKGYFDSNGERFYVTKIQWQRFRSGLGKPQWIMLSKSPEYKKRQLTRGLNIVEFDEDTEIPMPHGCLIKEWPYRSAVTLNDYSTGKEMTARAYIDTSEGRYYISKESWLELQKGSRPNWVLAKNEPAQHRPQNAVADTTPAPPVPNYTSPSTTPSFNQGSGGLSEAQKEALLQICVGGVLVAGVDFATQELTPSVRSAAIELAKIGRNQLIDDALTSLMPSESIYVIKNCRVILCKVFDGNFDIYSWTEKMLQVSLVEGTRKESDEAADALYWTFKAIDFNRTYQKESSRN